MSAVYEPLAEGTFEEYEEALAKGDFESAWQYAVGLALNDPDKLRVEQMCYAGLPTDNLRLVSGLLEALSILAKFRHRVNRRRLAEAIETIVPELRNHPDVEEELAWMASILRERPE